MTRSEGPDTTGHPFEYRKVFDSHDEMVAWLERAGQLERLVDEVRFYFARLRRGEIVLTIGIEQALDALDTSPEAPPEPEGT